MPKFEEKTEAGSTSKLYGKLPALTYKVASFEKTGEDKLGEALEIFGADAEKLAEAALESYNSKQRDLAGGAFWKLLKYARNLIKGGSVPGVSIETIKDDKGNEIVSEKTAAVIQALANSMANQIASLPK
jgi:hypothetical protein